MNELPSLSKELDNTLTSEVVPGEVTSSEGHYYSMFMLKMQEYHNTPAPDLWAFHIKPALKGLAEAINKYASKVCVRTPALPDTGANKEIVAGFISSDGKIPVRFMVFHRPAGEAIPDEHMLFTIEILAQKVD